MPVIEIGKGETYTIQAVYKDNNGVPIDLTGHTVNISILLPNAPDADPVFSQDAAVDSNGQITLALTSTVTTALEKGQYVILVKDIQGTTVSWIFRDKLIVREASELDLGE